MTARRRRTGAAALAGLAAGGLTLGVAGLVSALGSPGSEPLLAVGGAFVDATPPWLKDLAVRVFGTADKTALAVGSVIVFAALAALAGVLAARRWALGATLVAVLGLGAAVAAATREGAVPGSVLPSLIGAAAGLVALAVLIRRLPDTAPAPAPEPAPDPPAPAGSDRRTFLTATGLVAAVAVTTAVAGRVVAAGRSTTNAVRRVLRLPAAKVTVPPAPAAASAPVPGVVPVVTPNADFYRIDTALWVPVMALDNWSLRVHGLVEREVTITWDELLAEDLVEAWVTLACVSNPVGGDLVGNAKWLGWPIRELLARAGPLPEADMVLSSSIDGFTASTPLGVLTEERNALLAVGMNGELLPPEHGFPVRMVVPGLFGYVSATKWVVDLEVTRFADREAYWTQRGWSPLGPIKTASRIEVPRPGATVAAGPVMIGGTAWAPHRGIERVEVRVDDGGWQEATLAEAIHVDTWRQWSWRWEAMPGRHRIAARAWDPDGPQTEAVAGVVPDGATGYDGVDVTVE